jgi:hypothetical protein
MALATSLASAQTDITWMRANLAPATTLASVFNDTTLLRAQTATATSVNTSFASLSASLATLSAIVATHTDTNDIDSAISALPTITYTQLVDRTLPSVQYATNTDVDALAVSISAIPTTSTGLSTTQDATLMHILVDTSTNIPADIAGIAVTMSTTDVESISDAVVLALGTPASQSSVDSLTLMLTGQEITVISPLIDAGTIQITPGDTYNPDKASRLIRFKNTGSWSDLDGAVVTIEWTGTGTATCEVFAHGGSTTEQIVDVPLSSANTNAMQAGPFKIYATFTSPADVETLVIGQVVISGDVD